MEEYFTIAVSDVHCSLGVQEQRQQVRGARKSRMVKSRKPEWRKRENVISVLRHLYRPKITVQSEEIIIFFFTLLNVCAR